jgi:hypothetical protein
VSLIGALCLGPAVALGCGGDDGAPPSQADPDPATDTDEVPTETETDPVAPPDLGGDESTSTGAEELEGPPYAGEIVVEIWSWPIDGHAFALATNAASEERFCFYDVMENGGALLGEVVVPPREVTFLDGPFNETDSYTLHTTTDDACPPSEPEDGPSVLVFPEDSFIAKIGSSFKGFAELAPNDVDYGHASAWNLSHSPMTLCSDAPELDAAYFVPLVVGDGWQVDVADHEGRTSWLVPGLNEEHCLTHTRWLEVGMTEWNGMLAADTTTAFVVFDGE